MSTFEIPGVGEVGLTNLAGMDVTQVEARFGIEKFPKGVFQWLLKDHEITTVEGSGENAKSRPIVAFELECTNATNVIGYTDGAGNEKDESVLIGKIRRETFWLSTENKEKFTESIGFVKGFIVSVTGKREEEVSGSLQDCCAMAENCQFLCPITHRKDKNDSDNYFDQLDRQKIQPVTLTAATAPAGNSGEQPVPGVSDLAALTGS